MQHVDPYLPAEALGITVEERAALIGVQRKLSDESFDPRDFRMQSWCDCIRGHMEKFANRKFADHSQPLSALFLGNHKVFVDTQGTHLGNYTPADGVKAIGLFLTGELLPAA